MKSWPGSWATVWWVRIKGDCRKPWYSTSNLDSSEQKLKFWIIYCNCSWKLLSAPSTLDPWLTINFWRTSGRVKHPKHFYLCNMHLKCVLDVFIVKHFKTLFFFWIIPFPRGFQNTSLEEIDVCNVYQKKGTCNESLPYVLEFVWLVLLIYFGVLVDWFLLPDNSPNDETSVLIWAKPLFP